MAASIKKFSREDIQKDKIVETFFTEKKTSLKSKTRYSYISALLGFCNYTGKTPTEVYYLHKKDVDERSPGYKVWLANSLDKYIAELSKTHEHDSIALYISKIKSFLKAFRLTPLPDVDIDKKAVYEDAKYTLKVEDIQKAVKNSSPIHQAIIISQAQTGLAISDVLLLDVEDFILAVKYSDKSPQYWPKEGETFFTRRDLEEAIERVHINHDLIGCFDLHRKKSGNEFYTFAGPDCLKSIAYLLENRDKYLEEKDPIFTKQTCRISKKRDKKVFNDVRLTPPAVIDFFKRMHDEKHLFPKITVNGKIKNYFRTHKLRKWFATQIHGRAGLSTEDTKYLMGHKTGDVIERYSNPNNYLKLKNNYRKALPYLSITENVIVKDNIEAIERLGVENVEIRKENKELKDMVLEMKEDIIQIAQDPEKLARLQKQVQNK